jgi:organic radical activating enzyme
LLEACAARGWSVEVETNGTIVPADAVSALVAQWNVSPKLANSGVPEQLRIRPDALAAFVGSGRAAFKFVAGSLDDLDEVASLVDAHRLAPVWIMPEGTDPDVVLEGARRLADPVLDRGWNLTTRLHVLLWGDGRGR